MSSNTVFTNRIAENYEKYMAPMFFEPYAEDMARRFSAGQVNAILEVACGTGQVTRHLREHLPNARITATDLNAGMLEYAKKTVGAENDFEWLIADAQNLQFGENSFDAVICQFGLMLMPDKQRAVNEAYRVLRPGGRFIFMTWDKIDPASKIVNDVINSYFKDDPPDFYAVPFSMYKPGELRQLLETGGFKNIIIENISKMGYASSPEDAAKALTEGTPAYLSICERDEKLLPEIQRSASLAIEKEFGAGSFKTLLKAWIAEGEK